MDFHPLIVHFPIALLTVYSVLEVLRRYTKSSYWKQIRSVLVILGTLASFFSLASGEAAEHAFRESAVRDVLEVHSLVATGTTWIYAVLAAAYLLVWLKDRFGDRLGLPSSMDKITNLLTRLAHKVTKSWIAPLLAAIGFIGLLLTGALGAILVYGPDFDFVTSFVYSIFFGG